MKIILTDIHGHYSHNVVKFFLVCTRFHNEKSDITTTQEGQKGQLNGVPNQLLGRPNWDKRLLIMIMKIILTKKV